MLPVYRLLTTRGLECVDGNGVWRRVVTKSGQAKRNARKSGGGAGRDGHDAVWFGSDSGTNAPSSVASSSTEALRTVQNGMRLYEQGRLSDAEALYLAVLADNPDSPQALRALAMLRMAQSRLHEALEILIDAIGRSGDAQMTLPVFVPPLQMLADRFNAAHAYGEAIVCCDLALAIAPVNAILHNHRCKALQQLGRYDEALEESGAALRADVNDVTGWFHRGSAFQALARFEEAVACYRQSIDLDPYHGEAYEKLGHALAALGARDESRDCLDQARALSAYAAKAAAGFAQGIRAPH
jgi:tetratricopeptide (TPR) repeat protein